MIEQLFGSQTRVKLIKLFLDNPEKKYFVRELTRITGMLINSIRRELENLENIGFLEVEHDNSTNGQKDEQPAVIKGLNVKKYYRLNKDNFLREELNALFQKGRTMVEKRLAEKIKNAGKINYLSLAGAFTKNSKSPTDLMVIGSFDKKDIQDAIKNFEQEIGKAVNYTIMDLREYKLRKDIADRFLSDIMEDESRLVLVDDLKIIEEL
jgi:DNA-binding transcriptional regulator YhcF (GntR family)